jgi:hypothetical protein
VSEREWNPAVANQPQSKKNKSQKKEKELFLPNRPTVVMTHTHRHRVSSAVEGPTSYKKRKTKDTKQKVFFLVRDHPSPMQMNLFHLSEDVPLVVVVVVLVPSFFLANGFLICSRAQTHSPKSSQSKRQQTRRTILKAKKKKKKKELGRRSGVKLPGFELTTEIIL